MQHPQDRDREAPDVEAAFADPAFAGLKVLGVPFAILRPEDGAVLWANAAAAEFWDAGDAAGLARALFGPKGEGGWLDGLTRGLLPGRPPRLARGGLARGFAMRARTALLRAWTTADGATAIGLAVPDAPRRSEVGDDAWRRSAWAPDATGPAGTGGGPSPDAPADEGEPGAALARRGQLAVLRDRLIRALDGAATARLLWRTDASGAIASVDADTFARLGSPLRLDGRSWPDALAPFDPDGAERLRAALAGRTTWSGISVSLPVAEAAATVPMALSGSPVLGPERTFAGFRGFGVVDLGGLASARAPAPRATSAPETAAGTAPAATGDPPGPEDGPAADPVEPAPHANVVQFRVFQGAAQIRPAASDPSDPEPSEGGEDAGPEGGLDDRLAFLALGEALRARIAAAPAEADPATTPPAVPGGGVPPEASLLDRLPVPVLVAVEGRAVYLNPAAAARLGHGDPEALVGPGRGPAVTVPRAGRIAVADGEGRAASSAARGVDIAWAGAGATLWLLSEAEPEDDEAAPPPAAGPDGGTPPRDGGEAGAADLLDRVDDAVALLDAAGRVRRLNRRGEGWFGGSGEAALGRSFADLLSPESRSAALALLGEVRNQRDGIAAPPLRREVAVQPGEGAAVPMLLTLGRLGATGFYATLRDVTALKRAETDRDRTSRDHARAAGRLPDLLAKVSHDIRTPLGAILGFAEVMMDERLGPLGNPRYKDYLRDIHASGAQVVAMVDDLLDLSRIEAGQLDLAVAALDINRLVAETVARMQPEAHRKRVIMRTSLAGRLPAALADDRSARQIVTNLLSNAVKFNEPGGQVIVSTAPGEAGAVLLRVRDTGVGMTDEEIAAALEPFGGLPAPAPTGGNGLGLPLTRALVGANGAAMTIRSRPREGTLVEVAFLPAEPAEARLPA